MVAANDRIRIRGIGDALDRRRGRVVITEGGCSRAWVVLDGETNPILVDVDRLAVESGDDPPEPRHRRSSFLQDQARDRNAVCPCGKVFQKRYREQRFCSRRCTAKFAHHHDSTAHLRPTSPWRRAKRPDPPPTETECVHHRQIDAFQHGVCLRCGAERQFPFAW